MDARLKSGRRGAARARVDAVQGGSSHSRTNPVFGVSHHSIDLIRFPTRAFLPGWAHVGPAKAVVGPCCLGTEFHPNQTPGEDR